jgi:hypothetical protein
MSRSSSIRVATLSRIERDEPALICIRLPRVRRSEASGARRRGARVILWPGRSVGEALDPAHRTHHLEDLPEGGENADDEDEGDEAVEPEVGRKTGATCGKAT